MTVETERTQAQPEPAAAGGGRKRPPKAPPVTGDDGGDPSSGARKDPAPRRQSRAVTVTTEIDLSKAERVSPHFCCANCVKPYPDAIARDPEPHSVWEMLRLPLTLQEGWYTRTILFCSADCASEYDAKRKRAAEFALGQGAYRVRL